MRAAGLAAFARKGPGSGWRDLWRDLRHELTPPDRRWAMIQGVLLLAAALVGVLGLLLPPPPVEAAPPAPPPPLAPRHRILSPEESELLREEFPAAPVVAIQRVEILSELVDILEGLGLTLAARRVVPLSGSAAGSPDGAKAGTGHAPARQRLELVVQGPASGQAQLLRALLGHPRSLAIVAFTWTAGSGPDQRQLVITIEFPIAG